MIYIGLCIFQVSFQPSCNIHNLEKHPESADPRQAGSFNWNCPRGRHFSTMDSSSDAGLTVGIRGCCPWVLSMGAVHGLLGLQVWFTLATRNFINYGRMSIFLIWSQLTTFWTLTTAEAIKCDHGCSCTITWWQILKPTADILCS